MARPSDWWVLDLDGDPTPGDPARVRELAQKFTELSADAFEAAGEVRRLGGEGSVTGWVGEAGAVFGETIGEFPGQLDKLDTSYGMVGRALTAYAGELETAQTQADAALLRGREARGRLDAAQGQVGGAETEEQAARTVLSTASGVWPLTDVPASWSSAPPPGVDPSQVRTHTDASIRLSGLRTQVSDAQGDVDAERALAVAARTLRETAASTCKGEIDRASDAGIQNRSFWDRARDFVSDAWDVLVKLAEVVIVVAAVAALVLGGPVLWTLVVVAAAVVLADKLMAYANGEASLWDVGFALLNFVPGGKALTLSAGLARGASRLRSLGGLVRGGWGTARNMAGGLRGVRLNARDMASRFFGGDPVDVVTGQVTLTQTDVELPGLLKLLLERAHHSTYRHGQLFGPSWASTLDQRLEIDAEGACLPLADGTILTYPVPPDDGTSVLPFEGVRWPLAVDLTTGGCTVTDPQTGYVMHFPSPSQGLEPETGQVAVLPLAALIDRNDHRIDFDRDEAGVPLAVRHTGGYEIAVDTTDDDQVAALRLVSGDEPLPLVRFGYDAHGRLSEVVNSSGLPLRFRYDDHNRLTGWTDRNGHWYSYAYDNSGRCTRGLGSGGYLSNTFTYRSETRTTVVTDSLGHHRTVIHNEIGQVVSDTDPLGNSVTFIWSQYDWLLEQTDALGRTSAYRYDEFGNIVQAIRPDGAATHVRYDDHSRPVLAVEPGGARWVREFDARGNLTAETDPLGTTTAYVYNPERPGHLESVSDGLGNTTLIATHPAGMPQQFVSPSGAIARSDFGALGRPVRVVDPAGGISRFSWTPEGKIAARTFPDGTVECWFYDGEGSLVEHVDPAGRSTRYEYTHFDLLSAQVDPGGARLEFGYDTELRLTSVTNPQGLTWSYAYDAAGRLVGERDFDDRELRYEHDLAGQLVGMKNGVTPEVIFVRDVLGNTVQRRASTGVTTFSYDITGRIVRASSPTSECVFDRDQIGQVLAETVDGRTTTSTYDVLGRRIRRTTPSGHTSDWQWDSAGNPVSLQVAGRRMIFSYDSAGRELTRQLDGDLLVAHNWDIMHRLVGQIVAAPEPHVTAAIGRRARTSGGKYSASRRLIQQRTWEYSLDGYQVASGDSRSGIRHYRLDPARRVTEIVGAKGWRESYAYDQAGNLIHGGWPAVDRLGDDTFDTDAQGDRNYTGTRISRAGNVRYEHDALGRVILRQYRSRSRAPRTWRYVWDSDDRMTACVTPDGQRWNYTYDAFGRRIAKLQVSFDGAVLDEVRYTWDGPRLIQQEAILDHRLQMWEYEPGTLRPLVQLEKDVREKSIEQAGNRGQDWYDERFYAIITDLAGAPTELLTPDGTVAWSQRSSLWGVQSDDEPGAVSCPLRFPGQFHDPETGFNYNYFRHYDPLTARYASPDPIGIEAAPNPIAYVTNPTAWVDPLGLAPYRTVYHYTDRAGYNGIRSGNPYHIKPGSSKNGPGPFFTPLSPAQLTRPNAFKKLGLTHDKAEYVIEFRVDRSLLRGLTGGRGDRVFSIPGGIHVPRLDASYIGPTAGWLPK